MAAWYLSAEAEADFASIIHYVESESGPAMADRLRDDFYNAFDLLAASPRIGRVKEYAPPGVRAWGLHSYIIFYREEDPMIRVARILHGARDLHGSWD